MCFLNRNHGLKHFHNFIFIWVCLPSLLVNPEAALGSCKSSWIQYKVNSPHSCYCHCLFVHLPICAPYDFVLICGKFCHIQNHQHRVGTHAPSLCARRSLMDAIFLASAQLLISTGAGMKESSLLITELTNLILAMRKRGTSPNFRQKSWILLRQANVIHPAVSNQKEVCFGQALLGLSQVLLWNTQN